MDDSAFRAAQQTLTAARRRFAQTAQSTYASPTDFYEAQLARSPRLADRVPLAKIAEIGSTATYRQAGDVASCTEWLDTAIAFYEVAVESLKAGDLEGANTAASMGTWAEMAAVDCMQLTN
ncbi:hypothetical protein AB0H43_13550 [Hamadaea sp. NPDC050747]|uniref:hypothetical protein n=1 Tax=Hamadaea sp. NPDC050747 TaxID=3155789 RepID=UPI0033C7C667